MVVVKAEQMPRQQPMVTVVAGLATVVVVAVTVLLTVTGNVPALVLAAIQATVLKVLHLAELMHRQDRAPAQPVDIIQVHMVYQPVVVLAYMAVVQMV